VHFTNIISGQGGLWLDTTGGVPWSTVDAATSHWNLLPNSTGDWRSKATGSFATTSHFHLAAGQALTVNATILAAHSQPVNDVGFGLLMNGAHVVTAVLFARRPDAGTLWGDQGPIAENTFAPTSPGVAFNHVVGGPIGVQLGTVQYGVIDGGSCTGNCSCQLTAVVTPGPGNYNLLFGMFGIPVSPGARPSAMIASFSH
jgi:hypothetical protein